MAKKMKPGYKRCPQCGASVKGARTKTCPKCSHQFMTSASRASVPKPATAAVEKTSKVGDAVTLDQLRSVAQTVKAVGGFGRFQELLGTIREVGGLRRCRGLLEAMSATEVGKRARPSRERAEARRNVARRSRSTTAPVRSGHSPVHHFAGPYGVLP